MFFFFNFILVVCKFLLSTFMNFCFLLLHTLLHYRNSTLQRWKFCSRCFQLRYQKVAFFLKSFLKNKIFVKWCIFQIFLDLDREKGDFMKMTYFCWSLLHFFILKNQSLLYIFQIWIVVGQTSQDFHRINDWLYQETAGKISFA